MIEPVYHEYFHAAPKGRAIYRLETDLTPQVKVTQMVGFGVLPEDEPPRGLGLEEWVTTYFTDYFFIQDHSQLPMTDETQELFKKLAKKLDGLVENEKMKLIIDAENSYLEDSDPYILGVDCIRLLIHLYPELKQILLTARLQVARGMRELRSILDGSIIPQLTAVILSLEPSSPDIHLLWRHLKEKAGEPQSIFPR